MITHTFREETMELLGTETYKILLIPLLRIPHPILSMFVLFSPCSFLYMNREAKVSYSGHRRSIDHTRGVYSRRCRRSKINCQGSITQAIFRLPFSSQG